MCYLAKRDRLAGTAPTPPAPARELISITPSDSVQLATYAKALRIWVGSDITLTNGAATVRIVPIDAPSDDDTVDIKVPQGLTVEPIGARMVKATGTTSGVVVQGYLD